MGLRIGFLISVVLVGCLAVPAPDIDQSIFFEHADQNARIVGGTTAAEGAHPHMVSLSSGVLIRSFLCGGSVLSARTVLTAAHCIAAVFSFGSLAGSLRGNVGSNRWSQGDAYSFSRNVTHQHYVSGTIKNDIGVMYTTEPIVFSATVSPIALTYDFVGVGLHTRAAGWGRIRQGGPISASLLEVDTWTIDGQRCIEDVKNAAIEFETTAPPVEPAIELCVFHAEGLGMCNGDSGSALVRLDRGTQIGIVSWGFPCARGAPDMFVRISAYMNWVVNNLI